MFFFRQNIIKLEMPQFTAAAFPDSKDPPTDMD